MPLYTYMTLGVEESTLGLGKSSVEVLEQKCYCTNRVYVQLGDPANDRVDFEKAPGECQEKCIGVDTYNNCGKSNALLAPTSR